ncbi:MAG: hypothetical protein U0992_20725 [Planctomycetaceae bacterium]
MLDQADVLAELGLTWVAGQTVAVTGYPTLLSKADPAELLKAVVRQARLRGQQATHGGT